jgi:putative SOS response-associated peptidase YedK
MCKAYLRQSSVEYYADQLNWMGASVIFALPELALDSEPHVVSPRNIAPFFKLSSNGRALELGMGRWWLVSQNRSLKFAERPKVFKFNARSETVTDSPQFREAFMTRRCLVPAEAWYTWIGKRRRSSGWEFAAKGGGAMFFAGIWESFQGPAAGATETFAIITEPAGSPLDRYHDRAPVVLWGSDRQRWLDRDASDRELQSLLGPESPDGFEVRRVGALKPAVSKETRPKARTPKATTGHNISPEHRSARQIVRLRQVAKELEYVGRVKEAACYRSDAERIAARVPMPSATGGKRTIGGSGGD